MRKIPNRRDFWSGLFHRKIHQSWLIAAIAGGFLLGAGLAVLPQTAIFAGFFAPILATTIIVLVFIGRLQIMIIFAIIAGILLGLWRGTLARADLNAYNGWIGQNVILRGIVKDDPDFGQSGDIRLKLVDCEIILADDYDKLNGEIEKLDEYFAPLPGQIWASAMARGAEIKRSDTVEIAGNLKSGFGVFPASMSPANLENVSRSPDADPMRDLRDGFGAKLREVIPSPAADLGMGILAGQKTALPFDLSAAFLAASLTHIVVASGYNLTILVRFARRLFAKISRFAALSLSGGLVFAFACITGFSPSMTRASLVAGLSLIAWYYGRKFHPVVLLTTIAAITIAVDPVQIWGDAGWYMSFLSFVGVIILAPLLKSYFWGEKPEFRDKPTLFQRLQKFRAGFSKQKTETKIETKPREKTHPFRQIFIETLSAQILAAPIIALFMGNFSSYGLLANIVILPILPLAMLLTFIAGVGAFILPPFFAAIVAAPATWLLNYIIEVARFVSDLPGAHQELTFPPAVYVAIFMLIFAAIICLKIKTKHNFRGDNIIE